MSLIIKLFNKNQSLIKIITVNVLFCARKCLLYLKAILLLQVTNVFDGIFHKIYVH